MSHEWNFLQVRSDIFPKRDVNSLIIKKVLTHSCGYHFRCSFLGEKNDCTWETNKMVGTSPWVPERLKFTMEESESARPLALNFQSFQSGSSPEFPEKVFLSISLIYGVFHLRRKVQFLSYSIRTNGLTSGRSGMNKYNNQPTTNELSLTVGALAHVVKFAFCLFNHQFLLLPPPRGGARKLLFQRPKWPFSTNYLFFNLTRVITPRVQMEYSQLIFS